MFVRAAETQKVQYDVNKILAEMYGLWYSKDAPGKNEFVLSKSTNSTNFKVETGVYSSRQVLSCMFTSINNK